jgi:DNA repair photolyase
MKISTYTEIQAKSLLRKSKKVDSWFLSRYGMNLYRGCEHNCTYCDGRAERYYVEGEFGRDVGVKVNAPEILDRELNPQRKRKPPRKGIIVLGGGVGDSYQPAEEQYRISRKVLHVIRKYRFPVHILTKSARVLDDLELLKEMNEQSGVLVSFSLSTADDDLAEKFEPCASTPSERLAALKTIRGAGINGGVFLMPVIPFLSDTPSMIDHSLGEAKKADAKYVLFSGMTLKEGRQQDFFYDALKNQFPDIISYYQQIYTGDHWGNASKEYYETAHQVFSDMNAVHRLPKRIPLHFVREWLPMEDQVVILLEQLHYLNRLKGLKSTFGSAAYRISERIEHDMTLDYKTIDGVGKVTGNYIREWIQTGRCRYYEELLVE